jgi:nucleoid DNA-binding protein
LQFADAPCRIRDTDGAGTGYFPFLRKESAMAKKSTKKKTTSKKSTKKKASAAKRAPTKSQIFSQIAEETELSKRDVEAVFDSLHGLIEKNLKPRGPQTFTIPGLMKIAVKKKPAQKSRIGRNPATGEEITIPAKPASKTVKVRPLKTLKEMI